jgi:sulfite exporter TauE/SafE
MLDLALVGTLALMGLASVPHCALMCAAPCAAAVGGGQAPAVAGFQIGRLIGYAAVGAVAAMAFGLLREASAANAVLRPLWTLLQSALFALGLFLLISGRWPAWLGQMGSKPSNAVRWQRATGSGLLWFAWPCGVLQGALLVAALANTPLGAASAMAAFALASSPGLLLAPVLLRKLLARPGAQTWAPRLAGAMLVLASSWALGHGLWARIVAWCT